MPIFEASSLSISVCVYLSDCKWANKKARANRLYSSCHMYNLSVCDDCFFLCCFCFFFIFLFNSRSFINANHGNEIPNAILIRHESNICSNVACCVFFIYHSLYVCVCVSLYYRTHHSLVYASVCCAAHNSCSLSHSILWLFCINISKNIFVVVYTGNSVNNDSDDYRTPG